MKARARVRGLCLPPILAPRTTGLSAPVCGSFSGGAICRSETEIHQEIVGVASQEVVSFQPDTPTSHSIKEHKRYKLTCEEYGTRIICMLILFFYYVLGGKKSRFVSKVYLIPLCIREHYPSRAP